MVAWPVLAAAAASAAGAVYFWCKRGCSVYIAERVAALRQAGAQAATDDKHSVAWGETPAVVRTYLTSVLALHGAPARQG